MDNPTNQEPLSYKIGPFTVDASGKKVTIEPGIYRINKPIIFGLDKETEVTGVAYTPLDD